MKRLSCTLAVAVLGAALVAASAQEQQPRRGPGRGGMMGRFVADPLILLQSEQVQKELELVDDQKAKLRKIGEKMRNEMREAFSGLRDLSSEERRKKIDELREKLPARAEELRKEVNDVLLPHQVDRLKQIRVQMLGSGALSDKEVIETLGLTKEQQEKLRAVAEETTQKTRAMFEGLADLSQEARREKFAEIRDETRKLREEAAKKAREVLTPQQREKLEKLKGEKFELDRSRMFRRPAPPTGDTPDA